MHETLDSGERAHRARGVPEWSVRRKVALVLAVPLILAVALGGLRIVSAMLRSADASSTASQVTVLRPAVGYLSAAEDAAMVYRDAKSDKARRQAAVAKVRDAATQLHDVAEKADLSDEQRALIDRLLSRTKPLREGTAYGNVSTAISQLEKLEGDVSLGISGMADAGSRTEATIALIGQLSQGRLAVTQQQLAVLREPEQLPTNELYAQLGVESAAVENLLLSLPDDDRVQLLNRYNEANQGTVALGSSQLQGDTPLRMYDEVATDLLDDVEQDLANEASDARTEALVTAVLTLVALLVAVGLALWISRVLVVPIRKVRDGALAVANERLPETVARIRAGHAPGTLSTIDVDTSEEMGQLARAVDDLHGTAVRLAQDEADLRSRVADMFVTLSRRNTSLVNQQLHLIERLERDEEDSGRLESLFRLDHLASRMRRTAESLVVLADAPTQRSEQDSLTVTEALHAASAGVQDYQRVQVAPAPRLRINGNAAADVVHLLTELVDNALSFSPPSSPVTVTTSTPSGMVLVEIRDAGLGIDAGTMDQLNQELRTGGEITSGTTRRMGLLVVSRLARRHGITVLLEDNVDGGVTAQVFLPRPVLSGPALDTEFLPPADEDDGVADESAPELETVASLQDAGYTRDVEEGEDADDGEDAGDVPEVEPDREPAPTLVAVPEVAPPGPEPVTPEAPAASVAEPSRIDDQPAPQPTPPVPHQPEPVAEGSSSTDALSALIAANIGLPQRQPTARPPQTNGTGAAPALPTRPQPRTEPEPTPDPGPAPAAEAPTATPDVPEREELRPPVPQRDELRPPVAEPVAATGPALTSVPRTETKGAPEDDTPLFRMLRSNWFEGGEEPWGSSEADTGWQAADRATSEGPSRTTESGLPVRSPGNRLVPGGISSATGSVRRDPEAIRARLASHAAGVARGRTAAGGNPDPLRAPKDPEE